jgi:hypothetical protein
MPKSRKRRRPKVVPRTSVSKARSPYGDPEKMRPWLASMIAVDEAERRGDAEAAMTLIAQRPFGPDGKPFWRPWRVHRLAQVRMLGPGLPGWAASRWVAAQAHDTLGVPGDRRRRRCQELALEVRGGLEGLSIHGETDALAKLMDGDWVYRQLFLYDLGGLADFIRSRATPDLLSGADSIHDWCLAPMTALRLVGRSARTVTWERLDDGSVLDMPNIGSAAMVVPGDRVLGRVVPTAQGPFLEGTPLVVPRGVAETVADDPTAWWQPIAEHRDDIHTGGFEHGILSDVPARLWQFVLLDPDEPVPSARDFDRAMARRVLTAAAELVDGADGWTDEEVDPWACLHSAMLDRLVLATMPSVVTASDPLVLERLAESLAAPADAVCRDLAMELRGAA